MANARQIVKRRKSVNNIKKITRTMQLIATAKFQKALKRATATQPYTEKISDLVAELSQRVENVRHPLLETHGDPRHMTLLVLTSNRGLCGGYNANVLRAALGHLQDSAAHEPINLDVAGKKGTSYFRFLGRQMHRTYTHFEDRVRFEEVETLADEFISHFSARQLDAVHVAYMKFVSVSRQVPTVMQLLPLQKAGSGSTENASKHVPYEFSPDPESLLAELLPQSVKVQLYQCFMDATVSEQIARMVAMKAATDAATDMIKILTRTYNRARQSQITMELLDIMGGAQALK